MAINDKTLFSDRVVFALDIGTRSIIGIAGVVEEDKLHVLAVEEEEHTKRSMIDGQIEDIDQVAKLAALVKERLEAKLGFPLKRVCIAAAGRALITQKASYEIQLPEPQKIDAELISRLEAGAISQAEEAFAGEEGQNREREFFLVGYSVLSYYLDNYNMSTLKDHKGRHLKAEVIATFLPSEVVDSLYTAMHKTGLEVASLTLEPIAAINAAIPQDIRLLNLALVDIGAGTSDIAVCRDGGIVGYTMATLAGDEITETLMKQFLVDFQTAERMKFQISDAEEITFTDILGFEQTVKQADVLEYIREPMCALCAEISRQIVEVNNGAPSAVFLAGGGSKLAGLREAIAEHLDMEVKRVAIAGNNFKLSAFSEEYELNNPEFATPLGIAVSAGLNLINDSFRVMLNGRQAKLFKNGVLKIMDVLMMNGYGYQHMVGHSGQNIVVQLNGKRKIFYGERSLPAVLKLNGKDAKVTDIIHAGDSIEFKPAVSGKNAQAVLAEALEPSMTAVLLNGMDSPADTPLQTGDIITAQVMAEQGSEEELKTDRKNQEETEKEDGREAEKEVQKPEPQEQRETVRREEAQKLETAAALVPEEAVLQQEALQQRAQQASLAPKPGGLSILLNDTPLRLPPKSGGTPYYLMDILEYSGLDFEHISGNVILRVNGMDSTFLQELKNQDTVIISCEKAEA